MDLVSILIICAIVALCSLPFIFGAFRSLDRRADDLEGSDPEVAQALRDARKNIDRGKGYYDPKL